jgi:hypothetical protein
LKIPGVKDTAENILGAHAAFVEISGPVALTALSVFATRDPSAVKFALQKFNVADLQTLKKMALGEITLAQGGEILEERFEARPFWDKTILDIVGSPINVLPVVGIVPKGGLTSLTRAGLGKLPAITDNARLAKEIDQILTSTHITAAEKFAARVPIVRPPTTSQRIRGHQGPFQFEVATPADLDVVNVMKAVPETTAGVVNPTTISRNAFGFQPIPIELSRAQTISNAFKNTIKGVWYIPQNDGVAVGIKAFRSRANDAIASQATRLSAASDASINAVFDISDNGTIRSLAGVDVSLPGPRDISSITAAIPGAPTIQDVAARLPRYLAAPDALTGAQIEALEKLRADLLPFRGLMDELGIDIPTRTDIMDGGFYIPRGTAIAEGADEPIIRATRQLGGRASFERPAAYPSMAHGIANGETYSPLTDVLNGYVTQVGRRSRDEFVATTLRNMKNADGTHLSLTTAERVSDELRTRVESLRRKIQGLGRTFREQGVTARTLARAAGRDITAADQAVARAARVERKAGEAAAKFTPDNIAQARADLRDAITDAQNVYNDIGENIQDLRNAKITLTATERALDAKTKRLANTLQRATELEVKATQFRVLSERARTLDTEVAGLAKAAGDLTEKVDGLMREGVLLSNLGRDARATTVLARQIERAELSASATFNVLKREMRATQAEADRVLRGAYRSIDRGEAAGDRALITMANVNKATIELRELEPVWKAELRRAASPGRGEGMIDLPGLQGRTFPLATSNAINKEILESGTLRGKGARIENILGMVNRNFQGMMTTLDSSAPGIQGLLAWWNDPVAAAHALRLSLHSWTNPRVLGAYINDFDVQATSFGRLTSDRWASLETPLRLGGAVTEFQVGQGGLGVIKRVPGVNRANRAFGFYGDALRLGWADDMLEAELAMGRQLKEVIASGDAARIADIANNMTGWTTGSTFGSVGDLILFAPRFLQSRLTTVTRAVMGVRPGATLDQRIARKSMLKMVAFGSMLTFAINEMQGEETEWVPIKDGRWNSNFMRIRFAGRDWSLFGHWDSLARATYLTASGKPLDALQSMSSVIVRNAWDYISNQDWEGKPVRDTWQQAAFRMGENVVPISSQELPEAYKLAREGEFLQAGVTIVGEVFGTKSQPITASEKLAIARNVGAEELFPKDGDSPDAGKLFDQLNSPQQRAIDLLPRVVEAKEHRAKEARDRNSKWQAYQDKNTEDFDLFKTTLDDRAEAAHAGLLGRRDLRNQIRTEQTILATKRAENRANPIWGDALDFLDELDPPETELDRAILAYTEALFSTEIPDDPGFVPLTNSVTGKFNFDERDRRIETLVAGWDSHGDGTQILRDVEAYLRQNDPGIVQELRQVQETLRPYWDIVDDVIAKWGPVFDGLLQDIYDEYHASADQGGFLSRLEQEQGTDIRGLFEVVLRVIKEDREVLRRGPDYVSPDERTPEYLRVAQEAYELDRTLYIWEYVSVPVNLDLDVDVMVLRLFQGGEIRQRSLVGAPQAEVEAWNAQFPR